MIGVFALWTLFSWNTMTENGAVYVIDGEKWHKTTIQREKRPHLLIHNNNQNEQQLSKWKPKIKCCGDKCTTAMAWIRMKVFWLKESTVNNRRIHMYCTLTENNNNKKKIIQNWKWRRRQRTGPQDDDFGEMNNNCLNQRQFVLLSLHVSYFIFYSAQSTNLIFMNVDLYPKLKLFILYYFFFAYSLEMCVQMCTCCLHWTPMRTNDKNRAFNAYLWSHKLNCDDFSSTYITHLLLYYCLD